jgi:molybdopterin biosynthesis enzyme MoaB
MLFPGIPQFTISGAPKPVKYRALRSRVTASISMRSLIPELPGALEPTAMKGCAFPAWVTVFSSLPLSLSLSLSFFF